MDAKKKQRQPHWVGAFSILDFSGDHEPFAALVGGCRSDQRNPWASIGRDLEATGQYLHDAIVSYFETLPRERQIEVIRNVIERLAEQVRDSAPDPEPEGDERISYLRQYLAHIDRAVQHNEQKEIASPDSQV